MADKSEKIVIGGTKFELYQHPHSKVHYRFLLPGKRDPYTYRLEDMQLLVRMINKVIGDEEQEPVSEEVEYQSLIKGYAN